MWQSMPDFEHSLIFFTLFPHAIFVCFVDSDVFFLFLFVFLFIYLLFLLIYLLVDSFIYLFIFIYSFFRSIH